MTKKRRRLIKAPAISFYIVQVNSWDWNYSFGINSDRHSDAQFNEHRHLHLFGGLLLPHIKIESVELVFLPGVRSDQIEGRSHSPVRAVGSLNTRGTEMTGYLSMTNDSLDPVMQMLLAGRLKYVVLDGEPLRYRKALIRHYRMQTEVSVDDYPEN